MAKLRRYLIFIALTVASVCAYAQTASRAAEIQFTVFAQNRINGLFFVPEPGAKPVELKFFSQSRSPIYSYRGPALFSVYKGLPSESLPGQAPQASVAARLQIPEGVVKVLFCFVENPNRAEASATPYVILPLVDTVEQVPRGYVRVVNLSGFRYAAEISGERLILERGLSRPIRLGKGATIKLAAQTGEQWVPAGSRDVLFNENLHGFMVFFPPLEKGGISPNIRELMAELPVEPPPTSVSGR